MIAFCPEHPKWDQNPKFTPLSETTSIPTPSIFGVPPSPTGVEVQPLNRYLIYYLLYSLLKIITFQQTKNQIKFSTEKNFVPCNANWIPKEAKFMPYSNLRSIAFFVGRANKPRWARSTKPPFYAGWPCSGPSCIVVKNPAGYISFCLNILYLNLMIQEAIVTRPVQTGWFRNDTIFKPVCSDYC